MELRPIQLSKIRIQDDFWSKHTELVKDVIIPYQWDIMNDRIPDVESSHCLENFRIAAGESKGEFYGAVFQDSDIAKWLEAVGYSLASHKDARLEQLADEVIDLLAAAQQPDGYMDTYFIIKEPDKRWKNLCEGHELYIAGHMMEAAVAYYQGTGKRKLLDCMIKLADMICVIFGREEGKIHGYPGHQEIEIGLIKLASVTGESKYLDMAKYFLDIRGVGANYFLEERKKEGAFRLFPEFEDYDPQYSQSHRPVREQYTAEGHAVRAVYMYSAMADIAWKYQDEKLLDTCRRLWDNIVQKRMYITGGIGSSGFLERFTTDYDLPNDCNYAETCASIGMAMFGLRMVNITKESNYADIVELELYNTILAGIALDGKSFFYVNPLEVKPQNCLPHTFRAHVKPVRQKWFGVACCPPNVARTLASLGQYIYGISEREIYMHLLISNEAEADMKDQTVNIQVESKMPWVGQARIRIQKVCKEFAFCVRIPEYAEEFQMFSGGQEIVYENVDGYAKFLVRQDTELLVQFHFAARFLRSNTNVSQNIGKTAIKRGPVVYCFEEADNGGNLSALYLQTGENAEEIWKEHLGGVVGLRVKGKRMKSREENLYSEYIPEFEDVVCEAIPYAYWNNRGIGEMSVWMNTVMKMV